MTRGIEGHWDSSRGHRMLYWVGHSMNRNWLCTVNCMMWSQMWSVMVCDCVERSVMMD